MGGRPLAAAAAAAGIGGNPGKPKGAPPNGIVAIGPPGGTSTGHSRTRTQTNHRETSASGSEGRRRRGEWFRRNIEMHLLEIVLNFISKNNKW